jgi:hypothetical protein
MHLEEINRACRRTTSYVWAKKHTQKFIILKCNLNTKTNNLTFLLVVGVDSAGII